MGRLLRLPLRSLGNICLPILQGPLSGKRWLASAGIHSFWLGVYEHQKQLALGSFLHSGDVVLDIGAHAGYYSLLASDKVRPGGHVYAFEPLPQNLAYLQRHLSLNSVENVTVYSAAVSDRCGVAPFKEGFDSSTGRLDDEGRLMVSTVSLDELHRHRWIPLPDLIKIDVEGAELAVLEGARQLLTAAHPTLFLALHSDEMRRACSELLSSLDYRLEPIDTDSPETASDLLASSVAARRRPDGVPVAAAPAENTEDHA